MTQFYNVISYCSLPISTMFPSPPCCRFFVANTKFDATITFPNVPSINPPCFPFALQLNCGRFLENGNCGYVLRPECMFKDGFAPTSSSGGADLGRQTSADLGAAAAR